MSTETHQAELLARWLSESPDGGVRPEPPRGLDADVVDAVSALRPDRAPAPRLDIDDILFEVADGPLAEAVDPAAVGALGALLDEGDLSDDLDPDVLDAVSVLRPDRAPAPRVSIDDILAEVKTGPLAAGGAAGPADVLPPSVPETAEALPAPANTERPRGRMPGWLWPSLGGIAVAATALLFVGPMATTTMDAPPASTAPARYAEEAEPAPRAAPAAAAPMEEAEQEEARTAAGPLRPRGGEPGAAGEGPAPLERAEPQLAATKDLAKRDLADGSAAGDADARAQLEALGYLDGATATASSAPAAGATRGDAGSAPSGSAGVRESTTGADAYAFGVGGLMGGADAPPADAAPLAQDAEFAVAGPEQDKLLDEVAAEGRAAAPSPDPEPAPARRRDQAADRKPAEPASDFGGAERGDADLDDALAYAEAEDVAVVTETVASRGGGARKASKPRLAPRKSKRAEAPAAPAAAEAPPPPAPGSGEDLSSLRAEAWPLTSPPSTRGVAPEAWAAVDRAQAAGDTAGTQAALEALLRGGDDAVAQEAAWELARLQLRQGRRDLALVAVARGLERPGGHPLARSRLLAMQGEILEQRGDTDGAAESYRRAIQAR